MDCCGSPHHEITVQAGGQSVTLLRCGHCAEQTWTVDGLAVDREAAFAQLSQAYAGVSHTTKANRERIAADREARLIERRAHASTVRVDGPERRTPAAPDAGDVGTELSKMLAGWQVLGSNA
jgi:hypothetical protein